jgi:DNA-directed RNA polymerase specialized sigma24 family protein
VIDESRRRFDTEKSNLDRERTVAPDELDQRVAMPGRFPSPIDAAIAGEELERLLRQLPPDEREMVQLRLQGMTQKEIGTATHKSTTTVQEFFAWLWRKFR